MPRMPSVEDVYLILEYDEMTREMAWSLTCIPIRFSVDPLLMPSLDGEGLNGARLLRFTGNGKLTVHPAEAVFYRLIMSEWLFSIFKKDKATMKKFIAHELAHIKFLDHDEGFQKLAARLGAGELSGAAFKMTLRTDSRWVRRLAPLIDLLPFRTKTALLLYLGVKFELADPKKYIDIAT
jgi:hypothetical protein